MEELDIESKLKLKKKEDDIADLKKKIEDLSNEFGRMLKVYFHEIIKFLKGNTRKNARKN